MQPFMQVTKAKSVRFEFLVLIISDWVWKTSSSFSPTSHKASTEVSFSSTRFDHCSRILNNLQFYQWWSWCQFIPVSALVRLPIGMWQDQYVATILALSTSDCSINWIAKESKDSCHILIENNGCHIVIVALHPRCKFETSLTRKTLGFERIVFAQSDKTIAW